MSTARPPAAPGGGGGGVGAAAAPDETPGRKTRPVPPSGALDSPMPGQQTPGGTTKTPSGRRVPPATPWSEAPPAAASRELRDVYLAAGPPAVRPLVWFYEHDDGFDLSWSEDTTDVVPIVLSVEPPSAPPPRRPAPAPAGRRARRAARGRRDRRRQRRARLLQGGPLCHPRRARAPRAAPADRAPRGRPPVRRRRRAERQAGAARASGATPSPPRPPGGPACRTTSAAPRAPRRARKSCTPLRRRSASNELGRDEHAALHHSLHYGDGWGLRSGLRLHHFVKVAGGGYMKPEISLKALSQCMMLYPQDAELQTNGCERLCRAVIESSASKTLKELIKEINASLIVPIVINTMEVHAGNHRVITPAARLLGAFASMNGWLRANLVAAGVLPALCASLQPPPADKANGGGKEAAGGAPRRPRPRRRRRRRPPRRRRLPRRIGSARSMRCATWRPRCVRARRAGVAPRHVRGARRERHVARRPQGARGHVGHAGIVTDAGKVLAAYHVEFEQGNGLRPPPALSQALRSRETVLALKEAQRIFTVAADPRYTEIQLAAAWAIGVAEQGRSANKGNRSAAASKHKARLHGASTRPSTHQTTRQLNFDDGETAAPPPPAAVQSENRAPNPEPVPASQQAPQPQQHRAKLHDNVRSPVRSQQEWLRRREAERS